MSIDNLSLFLKDNSIPFEENVSLASKSWIKFGGHVSFWISPVSAKQLEIVCQFLYFNKVVFDIVGQTSNIFFHSTYNPQVVISTVKANQYRVEDYTLICECGCSVMKLAKEMLESGFAGFYGLVGLPGTVGAAAVNNAGCFGCSISSMLVSADVLMSDGTIRTFMKDDFGYEKRSSRFKRGEEKGVILSLKLKLQRADNVEEEYRKSEKTKLYRKVHQEGYAKNLGSVYARKKRKLNLKNLFSSITVKTAEKFGVSNSALVKKKTLLWLYGYKDLENYISNKNINTFVWRDINAEQIFERYKQFMAEVFQNLEIEIEEKK